MTRVTKIAPPKTGLNPASASESITILLSDYTIPLETRQSDIINTLAPVFHSKNSQYCHLSWNVDPGKCKNGVHQMAVINQLHGEVFALFTVIE